MRTGSSFLRTAALVLVAGALAASAARALPWEVGALLGVQMPDEELSGSGEDAGNLVPTLGARLEVDASQNWGLFVDGLFASIGSSRPSGDATMLHGRAGVELTYPGHRAPQAFFFNTGLGAMHVDPDNADSFGRSYWSLGVGHRWAIGSSMSLRLEARGDQTLGDADDVVGRRMRQIEVLAGLGWTFGEKARDSDGDGVPDDDDRCPDTPSGVRVDREGCPTDRDGDGVWDGLDKCPDTPAGATVDANGCPFDTDGDGVPDGIDECPGTAEGVAVDERGCPKAKPLFPEAKAELILEGVNFASNSDVLTAESTGTLDDVAESLHAYPDVKIEIGGHTDSRGGRDHNLQLSARRAAAVRAYLVSKGVSGDRMTSKGYGPDAPIADNRTEEGRAQNRRVELKKR